MTLSTYLAFIFVETILCLVPGPAVILIISQGLNGKKYGYAWGTAGLLTVNACYFLLSALGLGVILTSSTWLYTSIKWCGILYLVYVAFTMLFMKEHHIEVPVQSGNRYFTQAVALQVSNPKIILYFAAILPQFVSPEGNMFLQFIVLGITSIVIEVCILLLYGRIASSVRKLVHDSSRVRLQYRLCGLSLLGVAVWLVTL